MTATACLLGLMACGPRPPTTFDAEAYLWKRKWTAETVDSLTRVGEMVERLVVLGAEIDRWPSNDTNPEVQGPEWAGKGLGGAAPSIGLAIRAPVFSGNFSVDGLEIACLEETLRELARCAEQDGLAVAEYQIDFDCPQRSLAGYSRWLERLRAAVPSGSALTITALPSWLNDPDWPALAHATDGFVLQVHAVTAGNPDSPPARLCDPEKALTWAKMADRAGVPLRVALPTYTSVVGYDAAGRLLGVLSDGPEPACPRQTRVKVYTAEPRAMLDLRLALEQEGLRRCTGVIWFRLPEEGEVRNASWATFRQFIERHTPPPPPLVKMTGEQLIDLTLDYRDTLSGPIPRAVRVSWSADVALVASDAVGVFQCQVGEHSALFSSKPTVSSPSQPGGDTMPIGWLRFDRPNPPLHVEIFD